MFGFGRQKCRQCGEALESMGQSGDRRDDLIKSSAILQNTAVSGLCTLCRAKASASGQHSAMSPSLPPVSVPRTVAQISGGDLAGPPVEPEYRSGGGFKTSSGISEDLEKATNIEAGTGLGPWLIWLVATKTGRNVAVVFFFLFVFGLQTCSNEREDAVFSTTSNQTVPSDYRPPDAPIANPAGYPANWVTPNDYPARALAEQRQGTAEFNLVVDSYGKPVICTILRSSSHADLDKATCNALMQRARFDSYSGDMKLRNYRSKVDWRIPA